MKKLYLASANEHKVEEFQAILKPYGIEVLGLKDIDGIVDIEETGTTFEENAYIKAKALQDHIHEDVLADDSGLEIDFYNGQPGVYSHRFLGADTPQQVKNETILNEMNGSENRGARFVCVLVYLRKDGEKKVFRGEMNGHIHTEALGLDGFGYDPIFYYDDFKTTIGNVDQDMKAKVSHRGLAIQQFLSYLKEEA